LAATSKTPASPKRADCEICRELNDVHSIDDFTDQSFPQAAYRLEECGRLRRCPLCHRFYLMTSESDPHHYMSSESWLRRINKTAALRELSNMPAKKAKRWLGALNVDAQTSKLIKKIETDAADEAAATMAAVYVQRKSWGKLEALLRHKKSIVRIAAIDAVERSLARKPARIINAVASLLADKDCARAAHAAFSETEYGTKVSPLIITLIDCFDHDDAKVRALAVDLVIHHLDLGSGYYIDKTGSGSYRTPPPFKFGKATEEICARLPRLVEHILKPRPARWVDIPSYPRSSRARDFPDELNTRVGVSEVLGTLINQGKASKARVREALLVISPQLRKKFSKGESMDLDSEVYLFARDVLREEEG
jgi:hypothetical protein